MKLIGQNGYIDYHKRKYFLTAVIFLTSVLLVYVIGKILVPNYFTYFKVISALMILPTSQYFTKFLLFNQYKSSSANTHQALHEISDKLLIFADLILVFGKKTVYCDFAVLSDQQVVLCYKRNKKKSETKLTEIMKLVKDLYQVKGHSILVEVIDNDEAFLDFIKQKVKSTLNNVNVELQEQLGSIIIQNAI